MDPFRIYDDSHDTVASGLLNTIEDCCLDASRPDCLAVTDDIPDVVGSSSICFTKNSSSYKNDGNSGFMVQDCNRGLMTVAEDLDSSHLLSSDKADSALLTDTLHKLSNCDSPCTVSDSYAESNIVYDGVCATNELHVAPMSTVPVPKEQYPILEHQRDLNDHHVANVFISSTDTADAVAENASVFNLEDDSSHATLTFSVNNQHSTSIVKKTSYSNKQFADTKSFRTSDMLEFQSASKKGSIATNKLHSSQHDTADSIGQQPEHSSTTGNTVMSYDRITEGVDNSTLSSSYDCSRCSDTCFSVSVSSSVSAHYISSVSAGNMLKTGGLIVSSEISNSDSVAADGACHLSDEFTGIVSNRESFVDNELNNDDNDDNDDDDDDDDDDHGEHDIDEDDDGSSSGDWQDVDELPSVIKDGRLLIQEDQHKEERQNKTVQITLETSDTKGKSKKGGFDKKDWFRLQMNRFKKETQENVHRVHLLCLLAHGQFKNRLCSDDLLKSAAMSLLPSERISPSTWDIGTLTDYVYWFRQVIDINTTLQESVHDMYATLMTRIESHKTASHHEHVLIFVLLSRSFGLHTRLVYSLQPISFKPTDLRSRQQLKPDDCHGTKDVILNIEKAALNRSGESVLSAVDKTQAQTLCDTAGQASIISVSDTIENKEMVSAVAQRINSTDRPSEAQSMEGSVKFDNKCAASLPDQPATQPSRLSEVRDTGMQPLGPVMQHVAEPDNHTADSEEKFSEPVREIVVLESTTGLLEHVKHISESETQDKESEVIWIDDDDVDDDDDGDDDGDGDGDGDDDDDDDRVDIVEDDDYYFEVNDRLATNRKRRCRQGVSYAELSASEDSSDDGFGSKQKKKAKATTETSNSTAKADQDSKLKSSKPCSQEDNEDWEITMRRTLSSNNVPSGVIKYQRSEILRIKDSDMYTQNPAFHNGSGCDWWAEIYLEKEEKWICVNTAVPLVNQPDEAEVLATRPMSYVLAFDDDGCVKDLTKKYAGHWLSCTRKLRLSEEWWHQVLAPYEGKDMQRDHIENQHIRAQLMRKSLPASISEYKNHPLYALERHLLKFEAIYPPNAQTYGTIRGEPIYARDCVYLLHSKDKWLMEGRSVKIGEMPYKIVQSRPVWNKPKEFNEARKVELYGIWQTEEYKPPRAFNGKVPVNEFGNVAVFKPWMVPLGTVHLPEPRPGLNKIARKLNIDCPAAVIAWDYHSGFNHPIQGGWVVCEEHKERLLATWEEDVALQKKKEAQRKLQQIYDSWRKLIKGLLLKERLKRRFDMEDPSMDCNESTAISANASNVTDICAENDPAGEDQIDTTLSWPQNFTSSRVISDNENVLPFEIK